MSKTLFLFSSCPPNDIILIYGGIAMELTWKYKLT